MTSSNTVNVRNVENVLRIYLEKILKNAKEIYLSTFQLMEAVEYCLSMYGKRWIVP